MVNTRSRAAEREENEVECPITIAAKDKEEDIMADQEERELPMGGRTLRDYTFLIGVHQVRFDLNRYNCSDE